MQAGRAFRSSSKSAPGYDARWEVGGDFQWIDSHPPPFLPWPASTNCYAMGRHALAALLERHSSAISLWLPDYFCDEVLDCWSGHAHIRRYQDDPLRSEPDWSTLQPKPRDMVLSVNYFGVRSAVKWQVWHMRHPCVFVEDHSHDPFSTWARQSLADYAFSSLRKTLPVPDGAILWSPCKRPLPEASPSSALSELHSAVTKKMTAMLLKAEYLVGRARESLKPVYRELMQDGESELAACPISACSNLSSQLLLQGVPRRWRTQRAANVQRLQMKLKSRKVFAPLFEKWPRNNVPMFAVLYFESNRQRDRCRAYLERNRVYCPVHWPPTAHAKPRVRNIAGRLLSIPADQRYTDSDMDKVAHILNAF